MEGYAVHRPVKIYNPHSQRRTAQKVHPQGSERIPDRFLFLRVADQQERADARHLPEEGDPEKALREHKAEHSAQEHKEQHKKVIPVVLHILSVLMISVHVTHGIDHDHRSDNAHDQAHEDAHMVYVNMAQGHRLHVRELLPRDQKGRNNGQNTDPVPPVLKA